MSTDVLISIDTTGSMRPAIREVRRRVTEALDKLFDNIPDLRIGIIAHGDYIDGDKAISKINFTNNKEALKRFVHYAPDTYGGDVEEFYELVMQIGRTEFDWKSENKIFIIIADATPHTLAQYQREYFVRPWINWKDELQELVDDKIIIYSVQALGISRSTPFFEELAYKTNGRKLDLNQFSDVVETIISICYHKVGKLEEYKEELVKTFRMNRNIANMLERLGIEVKDKSYTATDKSGLIPVPPSRFQVLFVPVKMPIREFVEEAGATFRIGRGFYQFTKAEIVQERKEVILRNKKTGDMFTGSEAREYIGLPFGARGRLHPGLFEEYEVFIQSTSPNRILMGNTKFLYEVS